MDIRQLQSLIKLIDCNFSVTRAADEMFIVQSAVSQHLKKLEDELEADLFIRKGKRLIGLTEIGDLVAAHARMALASVNSIHAIGQDSYSGDSIPICREDTGIRGTGIRGTVYLFAERSNALKVLIK